MIFLLLSIFAGSLPSDFQKQTDHPHPFEPCPSSPNCIIHSVEYDIPQSKAYSVVVEAIKKMEPYKLSEDSENYRIDAVFRIPLFGFKDDVEIALQIVGKLKSVVHIKSSSRVGYSDLGVNSRRVKRFLNHVEQIK